MDRKRLEEIRRRCGAATEGPWESVADNAVGHVPSEVDIAYVDASANRRFIAHARTDIPDLLAEVERLREALEPLEWTARAQTLDGEVAQCPSCRGTQDRGHHRDCRLVAALATGEGEPG